MKDRKKRKQREEVRKILHTMRLELAAQRLAQEKSPRQDSTLYLQDLMKQSAQSLAG
ncbi:MAG: hypothetical protein WAQ57_03655 [Candidatus Saccharimonadales bacterium]